MATAEEQVRREKVYRRFFQESLGRLRKTGLSEQEAGEIATEVAEESLKRIETPVYNSQQQFSDAVRRVCRRLSEGASYYVLIGEMPYLATARIDRIVAVAPRTDPPVEPDVAVSAKRAVRVERLSASTALLFTALALGRLGLWWAIGIGVAISVLAEIYLQLLMPAKARQAVGSLQVPVIMNVASMIAIIYFYYHWIVDAAPHPLFIFIAVVALFLLAFVVPGVTIAKLVTRRERTHRRALEQQLLERRE